MAKDSGAATQLNTHCQCANTNWRHAANAHWHLEELAYLPMQQMRSRPATLRCNVFKRRLEDWPWILATEPGCLRELPRPRRVDSAGSAQHYLLNNPKGNPRLPGRGFPRSLEPEPMCHSGI